MPDRHYWVEADGTTTLLPVFDPKVGFEAPPVEIAADRLAGDDGAYVRNVRYASRVLEFTFALTDEDRVANREAVRDWVARLNPKAEGRLRVVPHGEAGAREVVCRYSSGLDVLERGDPGWLVTTLVLEAHDPFWRDADETVLVFSEGSGTPFFPFPPLTLSPTHLLEDPSIVNTGDVPAEPVWVISGPVTTITLTNVTTGDALTFDAPLLAGESVTIDTRRGRRSVIDGTGANRYGDLAPGSRLWALDAGANEVLVSAPGSDGTTEVRMRWRRRYLTI